MATNRTQIVSIGYPVQGFLGWARFLRDGVSLSGDFRNPQRLMSLLHLRQRLWQQSTRDTSHILKKISDLELLVSGRFHACTVALALGTPVVGQRSNTGKISSLFNDAGLKTWRADQEIHLIEAKQVSKFGWSASELENLAVYLGNAKHAAQLLFKDLAVLAVRKRKQF